MAALSLNAATAAAGNLAGRLREGWRAAAGMPDAAGRPEEQTGLSAAVLAGIALLALLAGAVVAVAELSALLLAVSAVGCAFILRDFRVGVVLLILLMPISRMSIFPHALFG